MTKKKTINDMGKRKGKRKSKKPKPYYERIVFEDLIIRSDESYNPKDIRINNIERIEEEEDEE